MARSVSRPHGVAARSGCCVDSLRYRRYRSRHRGQTRVGCEVHTVTADLSTLAGVEKFRGRDRYARWCGYPGACSPVSPVPRVIHSPWKTKRGCMPGISISCLRSGCRADWYQAMVDTGLGARRFRHFRERCSDPMPTKLSTTHRRRRCSTTANVYRCPIAPKGVLFKHRGTGVHRNRHDRWHDEAAGRRAGRQLR